MIIAEFGFYVAKIIKKKTGAVLYIGRLAGNAAIVTYVRLNGVQITKDDSSALFLKKGIFTYEFRYKKYVPGVSKVKYAVKLFGCIPLIGFRGEIGEKYKAELSNAIRSHS
tara:strand:+ start:913 stop:1245 length:333 start_codon:yes stop_codon:yes gene_type:complete